MYERRPLIPRRWLAVPAIFLLFPKQAGTVPNVCYVGVEAALSEDSSVFAYFCRDAGLDRFSCWSGGTSPGAQAGRSAHFLGFTVHNKTSQHDLYDRHRVSVVRQESGIALLYMS